MEPIIEEKTRTFGTPSGFNVTIRESNGEDEEYLSKLKYTENGDNLILYLARVIVKTDKPGEERPTPEQIMKWKVADKYYSILQSRIHSLGNEMKFQYQWKGEEVAVTYKEDLNIFIWPLEDPTKHLPIKGEKDYSEFRVRRYPLGDKEGNELQLSSGKQIRYKFLTSLGEKKTLGKSEKELSTSDELMIRDLEWLNPEKQWIPVQNFSIFSSRDMRELREEIKKNDPQFEMRVEIKHPTKEELVAYVPAISMPDFFFPMETL